ncbi:hypothetical protein ACFLYA_00670, partial [Candidatus Dependentiae bacterium]
MQKTAMSHVMLLLFLFTSLSQCGEIIRALKSKKFNTLKGKKILVTCEKAPYDDVPSFGLGDGFLFFRFVVDYLETMCEATVAITPPKALYKFFTLCSDIRIIDADCQEYDEYTSVECRDLLHNIPDIETFESKKRFLG